MTERNVKEILILVKRTLKEEYKSKMLGFVKPNYTLSGLCNVTGNMYFKDIITVLEKDKVIAHIYNNCHNYGGNNYLDYWWPIGDYKKIYRVVCGMIKDLS
jgi:hypothetical protein